MARGLTKLRLRRVRTAILLAPLGAALLLPAGVSAQELIRPLEIEPDINGVDMLSGEIRAPLPPLQIPAAGNLRMDRLGDFHVALTGTMEQGGSMKISVQVGATSDSFSCIEPSTCTNDTGRGSTLTGTVNTTNGAFTYIEGGTGRKIRFARLASYSQGTTSTKFKIYVSSITYPNGETLTFSHQMFQYNNGVAVFKFWRPGAVASNLGYTMVFGYQSADPVSVYFLQLSSATIQRAGETTPLARLEYTGLNSKQITDLEGREYLSASSGPSSAQYRLPDTSVDQLNAQDANFPTSWGGNARLVKTVTRDGMLYTYNYTLPGTAPDGETQISQVRVTGPEGYSRTVDIEPHTAFHQARISAVTDSQGRKSEYEHDSYSRVVKVTHPEDDSVEVDYDNIGNIVELRRNAKPGSGLADIVETASFPAVLDCVMQYDAWCFRPTSTTDARGNVTQYQFSQTHGGLVWQLDPADDQGKRRKVKNTWTNAGVWRLTKQEICAADSAGNELTCGTADAYLKTTTYWNSTFLPASETVSDGLGSNGLTTTYSYDDAGRLLSQNGPLVGSDDVVYYRYDILGRRTWEIGPKGENGLRPATRTTYRAADDQVSKVETGTVPGTTTATSPAAPVLTPINQVETTYNTRRLATRSTVKAGATTYSVTQMSHDGRNREQCSAVRMNSATWSSLPASACTIGTVGAHGADRITRKHYDSESRVTRIEQGVGTSLVRNYATYTFTPNGELASMTDARGYKASMLYDGFDRQTHWYFPQPGQTGATNPNDYERYTYDANGNRLTVRKRDGSVLSYTYDKLDRVTKKTVPGTSLSTRDVFYRYDIRGLQTDARFDSLSGQGTQTVYDSFGRVERATDTMGGVTRHLDYQYDAAGNRTQLRFPDGKNVNYAYVSGGQFDSIKDHGNIVIADYEYSNRGELAQVNRDSTAPDQTWTYDAIGRLASTGWSNSSAAVNVTWGFSARNPASQILTETQSNDAYRWDGHADVTRSYTTNGLNEYTSVGGKTYCHDANGNLIYDGRYRYEYDVENRLIAMTDPGASQSNCAALGIGFNLATLQYDPLGRLHLIEKWTGGTVTSRIKFLYDGDAVVAEYAANGTMLARHVHGPAAGADDPVASYTGSGVAAADRRNLYADARGSIVLSTTSIGGAAQINSYDEYGVLGSSNAGRFQYTGQVWLPELGMYYYKARMYSPTLGRFMQADPIGYEDDVNLYAYVANDPVNGIDPTGMRNCNADDPNCIETPESADDPSEPEDNPKDTDKKDEIVVTGQRQRRNTSGSREKFFVVTTTDIERRGLRQRDIRCPGGGTVTVGTADPIPEGASAAHSHPSSHSGVPGPGDNNFGNTSNTGYVITPSRAYAIDRASNGTYRTRILSGGPLSGSERDELVGNMQNWESGNSSNSSRTAQQRFCQ